MIYDKEAQYEYERLVQKAMDEINSSIAVELPPLTPDEEFVQLLKSGYWRNPECDFTDKKYGMIIHVKVNSFERREDIELEWDNVKQDLDDKNIENIFIMSGHRSDICGIMTDKIYDPELIYLRLGSPKGGSYSVSPCVEIDIKNILEKHYLGELTPPHRKMVRNEELLREDLISKYNQKNINLFDMNEILRML